MQVLVDVVGEGEEVEVGVPQDNKVVLVDYDLLDRFVGEETVAGTHQDIAVLQTGHLGRDDFPLLAQPQGPTRRHELEQLVVGLPESAHQFQL